MKLTTNTEVIMLKKTVLILSVLSTSLVIGIQANDEIQLYSEAGYPYKNLINKAKAVKILFTEQENSIVCRVEVSGDSKNKTTEKVVVSKKQFDQAPLVSCLPRTEAKKLLTFDYL
ncbi:hypothetical protein ACM9HF_12990 [Colwellia sp. RE-S-Sl-9]